MEDKRKLRRTHVLKAGMISFRGIGDFLHRAQPDQVGRHAGRRKPARHPEGIHVDDLARRCPPQLPDRVGQGKRMGVSFVSDLES